MREKEEKRTFLIQEATLNKAQWTGNSREYVGNTDWLSVRLVMFWNHQSKMEMKLAI